MVKNTVKKIIYPLIKSKPDFLIIGTQKAGTTSLARYIEMHKQIVSNSSWKEIHYFDDNENYKKGIGWYLGHFSSKYAKHLSFEATPEYLYYDFIPYRIKKDLGKMKFIAILRDPSNRAYSAWKMYNSFADNSHEHLKKLYDKRTFAEAIYQELNSSKINDYNPYHYIDRGKYFFQIKRYFDVFSKNNLLILNFDDLKNNLENLLDNVCAFLEIDSFSEETTNLITEKKYNVGNKKKLSDEDEEILKLLQEYFAPFNEKLYNLVDKNFMW